MDKKSFGGFLLFFLVSCVFTVEGRAKQVDFSKRLSGLESKEYDTPMKEYDVSEKLMSKRFATRTYDTDVSRFQEKTSRFQPEETMPLEMYRTEELSFEKLERKDYRMADKMLSNNKLEEIRFNTLHHKFHDLRSDILSEDKERFRDRSGTISLADINRYQFQRNHSDEPGLPVTEAAGGEEPTR